MNTHPVIESWLHSPAQRPAQRAPAHPQVLPATRRPPKPAPASDRSVVPAHRFPEVRPAMDDPGPITGQINDTKNIGATTAGQNERPEIHRQADPGQTATALQTDGHRA